MLLPSLAKQSHYPPPKGSEWKKGKITDETPTIRLLVSEPDADAA